jgi:hypothetical protein
MYLVEDDNAYHDEAHSYRKQNNSVRFIFVTEAIAESTLQYVSDKSRVCVKLQQFSEYLLSTQCRHHYPLLH